jgi:hypothetical protein
MSEYLGWPDRPAGPAHRVVWLAGIAVVFIPMGLAPLPGMFRGRIVFKRNFGAGWQTAAPSPWDGRGFRAAYAACVVAGAAAGAAGGLALFRAVAG